MALPTILVVDDEPLNLAVLSRLLNPHHRVLGARSGPSALALLTAGARPDLILCDVMMPEMDGYAVIAQLQRDDRTREIPVIFVTALSDEVNEEHGLALGAVDYIVKPIKPAVVLARVRTHLALKAATDQLARQNAGLETELARRVRENQLAQDLTLCAMAELAETRDNETGHHVLRTQSYVEVLGRALMAEAGGGAGLEPADGLDEALLQRIVKAAPMHDIGKIGIPDRILLKPARLSFDEFEVMKTHARIGGEAIAQAMRKATAMHADDPDLNGQATPEALRFLEVARLLATHHHERWDGLGYPDGQAGTDIPLPARLMALADVYDALTTRRVYKDAWSLADAARYIVEQSCKHFDPRIVAAFVARQAEFAAIAERLAD